MQNMQNISKVFLTLGLFMLVVKLIVFSKYECYYKALFSPHDTKSDKKLNPSLFWPEESQT